MSDELPASPCISLCVLDEQDICVGCYRSASEVADWFMSSAEEKREILRRAAQRQSDATTNKLR
jgi:hypothetical protein